MHETSKLACALCGAREVRTLGRRGRRGEALHSVLCVRCGLVWIDDRPDRAALERYYSDAYREDYKGVHAPALRHVVRAGTVALDRFERIRPLLLQQPRLLDVGAGGGEFLYVVERLVGLRGVGLEPHRGYGEHARRVLGLAIDEGFAHTADYPAGAFDLVTIFHVLEHLPDPAETLARIARWLTPGGHAVVEVPNIEATCQSPASTFHSAHLYTFGAATLERLGLQAGLTPVATRHSPDGGNVDVVFVKRAAPALPARPGIEGNAERIAAIVAAHRALPHYLRGTPLRRALGRLGRQIAERHMARRTPDARAALDRLVERYRAAQRHLIDAGHAAGARRSAMQPGR